MTEQQRIKMAILFNTREAAMWTSFSGDKAILSTFRFSRFVNSALCVLCCAVAGLLIIPFTAKIL